MTQNHKPGDVLARLDFDPYYRSFRNASTHILAPELTEAAIRAALKGGHAYVSHDWMCEATGFSFAAVQKNAPNHSAHVLMGDEVKFAEGMKLVAHFPLACKTVCFKDGKIVSEKNQPVLEQTVEGAGVYRVEGLADGGWRGSRVDLFQPHLHTLSYEESLDPGSIIVAIHSSRNGRCNHQLLHRGREGFRYGKTS